MHIEIIIYICSQIKNEANHIKDYFIVKNFSGGATRPFILGMIPEYPNSDAVLLHKEIKSRYYIIYHPEQNLHLFGCFLL